MDPDRHNRTERYRLSSCEGKVAFLTRGTARAARDRRPGRVVYKCLHCGSWHVGTPSQRAKDVYKRSKLVRLFVEEVTDE